MAHYFCLLSDYDPEVHGEPQTWPEIRFHKPDRDDPDQWLWISGYPLIMEDEGVWNQLYDWLAEHAPDAKVMECWHTRAPDEDDGIWIGLMIEDDNAAFAYRMRWT